MCVFITIRTQPCNIHGISFKVPKDHPSRDKDRLLDVYTRPVIFCEHWDPAKQECKAKKRTAHKKIMIYTAYPVTCQACRDQYDKELKEVREGFTKRFFADAAEKKPKANLRIPPAWVYVLYEAWRFNHAVMAPGAAERVQSEKVFGATWRQEVDEVAERILAGIKPGENYENIELYKVKNLKVFEYNRYKAEATVRIGYAIQVFDALGKRHNSQEIIDKGDELWEKHKWHVLYSSQPKALAEDRRAWRAQNWNKNKQDYDKPEPTVGTITSLGDFSSIVNGMVNNPSVVGGSGQGSILRPQSSSSSSSSNDIYNASDQDNKKSSRSSKSHEKKGGHGSSKDNKGKGKDKSGSSGSGLIF